MADMITTTPAITPDDPALRCVKLLSVRQTADLLGVHVTTIWRLTQRVENPLPVVRFGERITRFRLTDLERFILNSADRSG